MESWELDWPWVTSSGSLTCWCSLGCSGFARSGGRHTACPSHSCTWGPHTNKALSYLEPKSVFLDLLTLGTDGSSQGCVVLIYLLFYMAALNMHLHTQYLLLIIIVLVLLHWSLPSCWWASLSLPLELIFWTQMQHLVFIFLFVKLHFGRFSPWTDLLF